MPSRSPGRFLAAAVVCGFGSIVAVSSPGGEDSAPPSGGETEKARTYAGSCLRDGCHLDLKKKVLHGPLAIEACSTCHLAVEGKEHAFELAREEEALCGFCHVLPKPLAVIHKPYEKNACLGCHDPHGGADRELLVAQEEPGGVCLGCHEKKEHEVAHRPYREGECSRCHVSHQSEHGALARTSEPELCYECHGETRDGLREARTVHGPLKDGKCSKCHQAHGSEDQWLLASAYPRGVQQPFAEEAFALCFACHESARFTNAADRRTGFRDPKRNLHQVHLAPGEKGLSCRACHDAHGSTGPHLLVEDVTEGDRRHSVGFETTESGGRCATSCHDTATYDRGPTAEEPPPSQDVPGKSPPEPGREAEGGSPGAESPAQQDR